VRKAQAAQKNSIKNDYFSFFTHQLFQDYIAKNKLIITNREYYLSPYFAIKQTHLLISNSHAKKKMNTVIFKAVYDNRNYSHRATVRHPKFTNVFPIHVGTIECWVTDIFQRSTSKR